MKLTITEESIRVSFSRNEEPSIFCPTCTITSNIGKWKYEKSATVTTKFRWDHANNRLEPQNTDAWTEDDGGFVCPECGERVGGRIEEFLYSASEQRGLYDYGDVTIDGYSANPGPSEPQSQEP